MRGMEDSRATTKNLDPAGREAMLHLHGPDARDGEDAGLRPVFGAGARGWRYARREGVSMTENTEIKHHPSFNDYRVLRDGILLATFKLKETAIEHFSGHRE